MGSTVSSIVNKLRDPYLVRKVQESFGVRIVESEEVTDDSLLTKGKPINSRGHVSHKDPITTSTNNRDILSLAVRAIKKKRTKRKPVAAYVMDSPPSSPECTTPPPEVADIDVETYPVLDFYFKFVSLAGYEIFFIAFLPYILWNIDESIARHYVILWCVAVYIGGAAKNIFMWTRPASPPAIRLEVSRILEQEYGFPSTHSVIATVSSLYSLYACSSRYELFYPMLIISIIWSVSVSLSRVYLGVHSVMDILGGNLIAVFSVVSVTPFLAVIDSFTFNYQYFAPIAVAFTILMMTVYPVTDQWSMDRGDTAALVGATLGLLLGSHYTGPHDDDFATGPFKVTFPTSQEMGYNMLRYIVGVLMIFPTRFTMKLLCFKLLPSIMPDQGILEVQKRPLVELPYKLITYSTIGFSVIYISPMVFELCQISRQYH